MGQGYFFGSIYNVLTPEDEECCVSGLKLLFFVHLRSYFDIFSIGLASQSEPFLRSLHDQSANT